MFFFGSVLRIPHATHKQVLKMIFRKIDFDVTAIGHRIVHGGKHFRQSILLTSEVLSEIDSISHLAPLHNPVNCQGVRVAMEYFPTFHIWAF